MIKIPGDIFRKNKIARVVILIVLLSVGLVLIMSDSSDGSSVTELNYDDMEYDRILEVRLKEFLESTDGIDEASVFITVKEDESSDTGYFTNADSVNHRENIVGVAIACTDGDRPSVMQKVSELVSTALGIDTNKIRITPIDKS